MSNDKHVIIIGAGFGGLATANLLAKKGYLVSVYEKNSTAGGRAGSFKADGFTFDSGPSWYLMPEVFKHYFAILNEKLEDYMSLTRLDPAYQVIYEDYTKLKIHAELDQDMELFNTQEAGAGQKLKRYLTSAEKTYDLATRHFLYSNFDRLSGFLRWSIMSRSLSLVLALITPMDSFVKRSFRNLRLQQILEYPMVFLGTSPFKAPSMYRLMSHMDFSQGVFYPSGGIYSLITALLKIGKKLGVQYYYDSAVTQIMVSNGQAVGVELASGKLIRADIVISNADMHFTETTLLEPESQMYPQSYWDKKQVGPSALLLYLGVSGQLPELIHHNLLFVDRWRENFETIYDNRQWPKPASLYVCKASHTDHSVAPEGSENVFVLVPGPARVNDDQEDLENLADAYIEQLAATLKVDNLSSRITYRRVYGPKDFQFDYNAWDGTALGLSHTLRQSAFFRPRNKSRKVQNLYYVGGNTVPGVGLPMCLISAELIYKRLSGDHSNGPLTAPIMKDLT